MRPILAQLESSLISNRISRIFLNYSVLGDLAAERLPVIR